jgi:hypothetical protein
MYWFIRRETTPLAPGGYLKHPVGAPLRDGSMDEEVTALAYVGPKPPHVDRISQ